MRPFPGCVCGAEAKTGRALRPSTHRPDANEEKENTQADHGLRLPSPEGALLRPPRKRDGPRAGRSQPDSDLVADATILVLHVPLALSGFMVQNFRIP